MSEFKEYFSPENQNLYRSKLLKLMIKNSWSRLTIARGMEINYNTMSKFLVLGSPVRSEIFIKIAKFIDKHELD